MLVIKATKMATKRLLLLLVLVCAVGAFVRAESHEDSTHEIVKLKSKLTTLEEGLKTKDSTLSEKETKILELQSLIQALQEESSTLRAEADLIANKAKSVEETATVHLSDKQKALKALEDQETRLQKAERGLRIAEAAMLKAKVEAEEKAKALEDLRKAWLPPWAATHAETLQKTASDRWSTHAEPVVKNLKRLASDRAADAHGTIKPHLDTLHSKVNPVVREKWEKLVVAVAPHLETLKKGVASSREYVAPHVETLHQTATPYVESVKEKSKPYLIKAHTLAAPHLERVNGLAGPHYRRVLSAASSYHEQLQTQLTRKLEKHKFLAPLATAQFVWFLAAAILALPFVTVFMFLRSVFAPRKPQHHKRHRSSQSAGGSSSSKKPRRARHADK